MSSFNKLEEEVSCPTIHPRHAFPLKDTLCLSKITLTRSAHVFPVRPGPLVSHTSRSPLDPGVVPYAQLYPNTRLCHTRCSPDPAAALTHTDAQGRASMVDVSGKSPSCRIASAQATVLLGPTAFSLLKENQLVKGDALAVAQVAGILASKQTSNLIPLCHPLPLDHAAVAFELDEAQRAAVITATCRTTGRTGVEMEALTAATVAALTLYDMCKAVSHDIIITDVKLVSKTGGKRDFHRVKEN